METTPAQELELSLKQTIRIAKNRMSDHITTMQSSAKDLVLLAEQAQECARALANDEPYQRNLGDHIEAVLKRYKDAERDMLEQMRKVHTLQWALDRTEALSAE